MVRVSIEMNNLSALALGGCERHLNMIFVTSKWILEPFPCQNEKLQAAGCFSELTEGEQQSFLSAGLTN